MRKRPFLLLACMFLAGILLCGYRVWILVPAPLLFGWFVLKGEGGRRRRILLVAIPVFLAAGAFRMGGEMRFRGQYLPELRDGQEVRLQGEVAWIEKKSRCVYVYLTNCMLSSRVRCSDVLAYASTDDFSVGQILVVRGTIALFERAANEGGFDAERFYQSRGIDFGLWVSEVERVCREARPWQRALFSLRERIRKSIADCGGADGILSAMLLGEKTELDFEVKQLYQMAGISHILAISGLHVTLLGIGFYHLLRRMGLRYLTAGGLCAFFTLGYGIMTGGSVPTCRAIGMVLVLLAADLLGRGYDMLNALGLVCIVLLWENPFLIGYSGFWFSVAAVLGVGAAGPILTEWGVQPKEEQEEEALDRAKSMSWRERMSARVRAVREGLWTSLGIQLMTLPLVAYSYYELPVYALLINTVVLALVKGLLVLGCGAAAAGMWSVALGSFLMAFCNRILYLYEWLCTVTLGLPAARIIVGCPRPWQVAVYYLLFAAILLLMHKQVSAREGDFKSEGRWTEEGNLELRKPWTGALRVFGVLICSCGLFAILAFRPAGGFEIDVLDVGQGDGIYLRTDEGISMFVDGGSTDVSGVGTYRILPFLKYRGVKRISYWFVSHADADHVNGMKEVLESGYPVEHLVLAEAVRQEEKTADLAALAERCGVQIHYLQAGDRFASGDVVLRCLYPEDGEALAAGKGGEVDLNDLSLVLLLEYGDFRGIFTGDISEAAERKLLKRGACATVDFLKVAHHGSKYSGSSDFLRALSPKLAVISSGRNNRFGHPHAELLERLEDCGCLIYRTQESGEVMVRVKDGRVRVEGYYAGASGLYFGNEKIKKRNSG
ncbi:MAG: DNA internalization-related competence protein ComEC/Rec2 [Agathobacter sp.]|nr:DNA internalization-related competence protein ComEC/Rec2 [Agathobacter sp.]